MIKLPKVKPLPEGEIVPLSIDLLFKKVFGNNDAIKRLEALLSIYFNAPYEELKGNVKVLNSEKRIKNKNSKRQSVDVLALVELVSGTTRVNIEVNLKEGTTLKRNFLYASGILSNQLHSKDDYSKIEPVVQISFDNYEVNEKNDRIVKRCFLKDETNTVITDILEIDHINIVKCKDAWYNKTIKNYDKKDRELIKLGALLTIKEESEFKACLEELTMEKEIKEDIVDAVEEYSEDDEILSYYYDKEHNDEAIRRGDISLAKQQGHMEGLEQGHQEKAFEIAKNLLSMNMSIDDISIATGLPIEEIKNIKSDE